MIYRSGFNLVFATLLLLTGIRLHAQQPLVNEDLPADAHRQVDVLYRSAEDNLKSNASLALDYATKALRTAQENGYTYGIAKAYYLLGKIYGSAFQDFDQGIHYHTLSISAAEKIDSVEMLATNYFSLGNLYHGLGLYATALHQFTISLQLYRKEGDWLHEALVQAHIASIYSEWGGISYDTIELHYTYALKRAKAYASEYLLIHTLCLYTTSLTDRGHFAEAEKYLAEALAIAENNIRYHDLLHQFYSNMGEVLLHKKETVKAIGFFERSKDVSREHHLRSGEAQASLKLGKACYRSNDLSKAEYYYQDALAIYRQLHMRMRIIETYGALATLASALNNFEKAFQYRSSQQLYEDSIYQDQKNALVQEINTHATEVTSESKTLIEKKNAHLNELYLTLLFSIVVTLIFLTLLYLNHQRLRTAKERSMLVNEKLLLQKELETKTLEEEQLRQKLEFHAKTLTANTLNLIQKNEILERIKVKAEDIRKSSAIDMPAKLNNLMHAVNFALNLDKDWENFRIHFEQVHNNFFDHLKSKFPDLNSNDLKLCALLKLNLDTKQIATVMDISPESVKVARSRLRKKLQLEQSANLSSFITHV